MPRTTLVKTVAPGSYPTDGVTVTQAAADIVNKNQFLMSGDDLLLAHNTAVGASTVTLSSVANARGRTGDITTDSLAAGATHVYGPFKNLAGWVQSDGYFYLEASAVDVKFMVIKLPRP